MTEAAPPPSASPASPLTAPHKPPPEAARGKAHGRRFWSPREDYTVDEATAMTRFARLRNLVMIQTWAIAGLTLLVMVAVPYTQPTYIYLARTPDKKIIQMTGLDMPNMTNRAILAWATTSITEIMTMGFGDIDYKVPRQKWRFTDNGWQSYIKAFVRRQIGDTFKQNQLVLTTVPSNTPVIIAQGVEDDVYQWEVQMPVVMTYATNNNVTRQQHAIITLMITRVPAEDNAAGIAIKSWNMS